jgi:hypothetical protein
MGKLGEWFCKNDSEEFPIIEFYTQECDLCLKKALHIKFLVHKSRTNSFWFVTFAKTIPKDRQVQPKKPEFLELPKRISMYRRWDWEGICEQTYPISNYCICSTCNEELRQVWKHI